MPPKVKITKEDIINTALELVRAKGEQSVNARNIASALNCSTQPVFSNFATMDDLRLALLEKINSLCREFMKNEEEKGEFPSYKANGMAYIRFAKEEKELFKLLYMRDRRGEDVPESTHVDEEMERVVRNNTGLDEENATLFHLEMWAFVHGIASMFATGFLDLDMDLVSRMLTDAYQGLRKQYGSE